MAYSPYTVRGELHIVRYVQPRLYLCSSCCKVQLVVSSLQTRLHGAYAAACCTEMHTPAAQGACRAAMCAHTLRCCASAGCCGVLRNHNQPHNAQQLLCTMGNLNPGNLNPTTKGHNTLNPSLLCTTGN
mmetsp:Transcript_13921/g.30061  ORF Transcript_13921/g.30061 Transcript_13921/m.30061 type:complete len:129 (+) Transcript_13921:342-728(+)